MKYLCICCLFNDAIINLEARADKLISDRMGADKKIKKTPNGCVMIFFVLLP
jgi:hypothetical protein